MCKNCANDHWSWSRTHMISWWWSLNVVYILHGEWNGFFFLSVARLSAPLCFSVIVSISPLLFWSSDYMLNVDLLDFTIYKISSAKLNCGIIYPKHLSVELLSSITHTSYTHFIFFVILHTTRWLHFISHSLLNIIRSIFFFIIFCSMSSSCNAALSSEKCSQKIGCGREMCYVPAIKMY